MRVQGIVQPSGDSAEEIDGYRDFVQIGQGGFSVVYRARQEHLDREVAVKVLAVPEVDEKVLGNFLRECQLASRLTGHPNVVTVLDTGTTRAGRPYVTMEYFAPGSLKQRLNRAGPLPLHEVLRFGIKIAGALAAAHSAGILHRDIKPDNILVSSYGEPALADFGVARLLDASDSSIRTDALTLHHTAPEILAGAAPSQASDVYALGSTLYQLLSGYPAHRRDNDESIASVMQRILSENPPDIPRPEIPDQVMGVIRKAMAKQQQDRFTDALTLAAALQHLQAELGFTVTELPPSGAQMRQQTQLEPVPSHPSSSRSSNPDNNEIRAIRLGMSSHPTPPERGTSAKISRAGRARNDNVPSQYHRWRLVLISLIPVILVTCGGVVAWRMVADSKPTTQAQASSPSTAAAQPSTSVPISPSSVSAIPVPPLPPAQAAPAPQQPTASTLPPPKQAPAPRPAPEPPQTAAPQQPPVPAQPLPEEPESPPATTSEPTTVEETSPSTYNAQQLRLIDRTQNGIFSVAIIGHNQNNLNLIDRCFETPDVVTDINDMWWAGDLDVYIYSGSNCTNPMEDGYLFISVPSTFDGYYWTCLTVDDFSFSYESC